MRPRSLLVLAVAAGAALMVQAPGPTDPADSSFASGVEGWTLTGDARGPIWVAEGGNPGGYITGMAVSQGADWAFRAPAAYRGNHAGAYGHTLRFDVRTATVMATDPVQVLLTGNGVTLTYEQGLASSGGWKPVMAPLIEGGGWRRAAPGMPGPATRTDLVTVLKNVTDLQIRAPVRDMLSRVDLDSVELPEGMRIAAAR